MYLQAVLANSALKNRLQPSLTYVRFDPSEAHPIIWTTSDYQELTQANAFFARKFDMNVDSKVLDLLDHVSEI